jgi:S-adenosylmethionine synthetase
VKVVLACATQFFIPTALLVYHYTIIRALAYSLADSLLLGDQDAKVTLRRLSDALGKVQVVLVYLHHHHHHHHHHYTTAAATTTTTTTTAAATATTTTTTKVLFAPAGTYGTGAPLPSALIEAVG